jgi:hypothetical protein
VMICMEVGERLRTSMDHFPVGLPRHLVSVMNQFRDEFYTRRRQRALKGRSRVLFSPAELPGSPSFQC